MSWEGMVVGIRYRYRANTVVGSLGRCHRDDGHDFLERKTVILLLAEVQTA